jgi:PEGA domain
LIQEVAMTLRILCQCAATIVFTLIGASALRGQSVVEYGTATSNTAGTASSVKPLKPQMGHRDSGWKPDPVPTSNYPSAPAISAEEAAKTNRQFFQDHSGPDAAQISLHTEPDHARVWIDYKLVGSTPLDLKLAPGHHRISVFAPYTQESVREVELAAKQKQHIDFSLKPEYQSQVTIHWTPQK